MRICIVYDCLFPHTVGGAERWYRNLAQRLAADGHEVTYLTLRQWDRGADPGLEGVRVRVVGPRMKLYAGPGRRRVLPPLVFGAGVLVHLLRHGRRYDALHTASFPYFSLLAAALCRPLSGYRLVVDWHEVWTRDYWRGYLGPVAGEVGWLVQRLCQLVPQRAFCFSALHASRLRAARLHGEIEVLEGEYVPPPDARPVLRGPQAAEPLVLFVGRHIPEKRPAAVVGAVLAARAQIAGLRGLIFGDGPERATVLAAIGASESPDALAAPGFVDAEVVEHNLARALCLLLPSRREGYGLIVVEAASLGVPSIVVRDADSAATELISDGENGVIAASAEPAELAAAIIRVSGAGAALRSSTLAWFKRNEHRLSLEGSLDRVLAGYARLAAATPSPAPVAAHAAGGVAPSSPSDRS